MEKICRNCEHYIRHFVSLGKSFSPIDHGHCTYPMLKNREAGCKACKHFEERKKDDRIQVTEIRIEHKIL